MATANTEVFTIELAKSVQAKVVAEFTASNPRQARLFVDGVDIGTQSLDRSFPAGRIMSTQSIKEKLGDAIDGGAPVAQLSLSRKQASEYRAWRHEVTGTKECCHPQCKRDASMSSPSGPVCMSHYDGMS